MTQKNQTPSWFRYPKYDWKNKHAVVIGAGIAGCQTTWHLVQQGWQVTLIDREKKIAQQASGNPAGIISPKMTAQASSGESFYVDCFNYAIKQLKQLKQKHSQLDWHDCGLLQLAHNDREQQRWLSLKKRHFDRHFLQCIDKNESSEIAGIPINYKASYFPLAGWINPVSFCEVLLADCGDNCNIILEADVLNFERNQKTWELHNQDKQIIASAEVVIICSGKDLNQFPQTNTLPSMSVAGQTTSAPRNAFVHQLRPAIGHEGYLTPISTRTSQLTFGASFERNIKDTTLDSQKDKTNLDQLHKYLPQLADSLAKINSAHAAIRMTTPDRFPYVGGLAQADFYQKNYHDLHQGKHYKNYLNAEYLNGLFVLGGLGSRGLTTSGLCAKMLSDLLENKIESSNKSSIRYCHPARFVIKQLKQNR